MTTWEGKTRGGLLGYKIFVLTIKYLGLFPAYFLLRFVALYYFLFARKSNRFIYHYFRNRLGYGRVKSFWSVYANYYIFGQVLIDKVAALSGFAKKFTYYFDGEEYLREMTDGGLLISAHIGNWEIAGNLLKRLDKPFNIVMFDEEHGRIKDYLESILKEKNVKIIVIKDDLSHLIAIRKALQEKELIAIHGDRFLEGTKTIPALFLGAEALFPEGPFYLAAKFKAPVSFVFAMKETRSHYHFYATPAKVYEFPQDKRISHTHLKPILHDYVLEFERILNKYPVQWFNYYDFWGKD
jgi:predicted LPLAT superfamily acyltransferase